MFLLCMKTNTDHILIFYTSILYSLMMTINIYNICYGFRNASFLIMNLIKRIDEASSVRRRKSGHAHGIQTYDLLNIAIFRQQCKFLNNSMDQNPF